MNKKIVVLKVGGSLLSPSEEMIFDINYANNLKQKLLGLSDQYQFILSIGGGNLSKLYQKKVQEFGGSEREINWIGTSACNHNAVMMRCILGDYAEDNTITFKEVSSTSPLAFEKTFQCVGANEPGHSSDVDAVIMAKRVGANTVISLKNVDGVYSDDPNKNQNAKKFEKLTWDEYSKILGTEKFTPKMASPIDPIATKDAKEAGLKFKILDGSDLDNLVNAILEKEFTGSTIS